MRPLLVIALLGTVTNAAERTDFFFRFIGGNSIIAGQRLRSNSSITYLSPGVTPSPQNPKDHFNRISFDTSSPSLLKVVPTNPHPPPVPGYYGLSDLEGVKDAYRLVWTYRLDDEGPGFRYMEWDIRRSKGGRNLLRYSGDIDDEWRWIAVKEKANQETNIDKWVPWLVRPSAANVRDLVKWDYDIVDLELVETMGAVNSAAPGGVDE